MVLTPLKHSFEKIPHLAHFSKTVTLGKNKYSWRQAQQRISDKTCWVFFPISVLILRTNFLLNSKGERNNFLTLKYFKLLFVWTSQQQRYPTNGVPLWTFWLTNDRWGKCLENMFKNSQSLRYSVCRMYQLWVSISLVGQFPNAGLWTKEQCCEPPVCLFKLCAVSLLLIICTRSHLASCPIHHTHSQPHTLNNAYSSVAERDCGLQLSEVQPKTL